MKSIDVEVLLPVHNEGESIEATIRGIYGVLSTVVSPGFIVCEDGSRDDTKQVLQRLAGELPMRLNLSDARKSYSKAVREGMSMLQADYLLCIDSDGQCDPRDFARFWQARGSADIVIGWRAIGPIHCCAGPFQDSFICSIRPSSGRPCMIPAVPMYCFPRLSPRG